MTKTVPFRSKLAG